METIIEFWKDNKKLWLPISEKDKIEADSIIYNKYFHTIKKPAEILKHETFYSTIIYYDQFLRHFDRHAIRNNMSPIINETELLNIRKYLAELIKKDETAIFQNADEIEVLFSLMVFKHIGDYEYIFYILHNKWLGDRNIAEMTYLSKFYYDTYRKAFTFDKIYSDILAEHTIFKYNPDNICEYYPEEYQSENWSKQLGKINIKSIITSLKYLEGVPKNSIVSLSGGVDSMVLLYLLKYLDKNPLAVHIIYGNRSVSEEEYHFVANYCQKLDVPLYTYRIQWLRRNEVDREFYEEITRLIRFMVYRAVGGEIPNVIMGHIKEDVVENIWTNLAKCQHLHHLKKMEYFDEQLGVKIIRPFLEIDKKTIYDISSDFYIPFLNNTTPIWSNRGKFRNGFYQATHLQFGKNVDDKLIKLSNIFTRQSKILDKLLFEPIFNSWNPSTKTIKIDSINRNLLDIEGWQRIFEWICHQHLSIGKPSIHSIQEFINRQNTCSKKGITKWNMPLKKGINIIVRDDTIEFNQ